MENNNISSALNSEGNIQIKIKDVILFFQKYLLSIVIAAFLFAVLGFAYSYTLPKTYKAQSQMLPEYSMGNTSFFSAMNAQISEGAEKLTPDLYPIVLRSSEFGLYLLKQPVIDQNNRKYPTLKVYFEKTAKAGKSFFLSSTKKDMPVSKPSIQLPNKNILTLSPEELQAVNNAVNLVRVSVEKKEGVITIESEMQDPVIASQLVEAGKSYLIKYVEDYRTAKTQSQADFLKERVKEARRRQQNAEYALQSYRDHNRNTFLNVARIEEQRLQTDYTLAQSLYGDLVSRLEQANLKVKQEKPVFKILEPVKVPFDKNSPKRMIIALISGVAGAIIFLLYILFYKEKIHHNFIS